MFSKTTERLFLLCVGVCGKIVLVVTLVVAKDTIRSVGTVEIFGGVTGEQT